MNDPKTYTANDIERYHGGLMSAAEMHALEKAALDDPFLADALEGYTLTKTPSTDLATLRQRLQQRVEKKEERRGLFFIGSTWMRIAALFVLFAGGGWLVYQTLTTRQQDIATTQQVPQAAPTPESKKDSVTLPSNVPINEALVTTQEEKVKEQRNDEVLQETVARRENRSPAPPAMFRMPADSTVNQGYVTSEAMTIRDKAFDSTARNEALAKQKESASVPLPDTIKNLDVVMKRTEVDPEEIIVFNNKAKAPQARRIQVVIDSLEPAGGWTNFNDYIASNLRAPEELQSKPSRGEVELSFDVNKNGEPVNITVVKSLCTKCDEEAIRLLKEGPKWKKNKNKGKIKIRF